jgi:hypothetical protein
MYVQALLANIGLTWKIDQEKHPFLFGILVADGRLGPLQVFLTLV